VYNTDADNTIHENLRKQADRIINTWNIIRSSKRCFEEYSDIGAREATAHIERMSEARTNAQRFMEEIRAEWLWRYVSRSRQRWLTGAATGKEQRLKQRDLVGRWELMATHLGREHDETPGSKHSTLEDKIVGGNETRSWYDVTKPDETSKSGRKLHCHPHRQEMRRRWREQHPDISYTVMLAQLSTCMGEADRMNKCRDAVNTPLALQGISDRMQVLLDDNVDRCVHEHGVRTHSPSDGSPVIFRHPAGKLALRNASDQWGRPAGKTTHTGKAVIMPARNSGASFERGLDDCEDSESTEINVNALAIINSELSDTHRDIIASIIGASGERELAEAEATLAQLNDISGYGAAQMQRPGGEALGTAEESNPQDNQSSFFHPSVHPLHRFLHPSMDPLHSKKETDKDKINLQGSVYEGFTEESPYTCNAPDRISTGYIVTQSIGGRESRGSVLVTTPTCEVSTPDGHQGIYVNFPDTPGGGPGVNCRNGYYTQAMQITTNDDKHPYTEQWCEPISVQRRAHYEGRQDFWTSVRSRSNGTHRWLGSLWKQMDQIDETGDEAEKGIKDMALGQTPIPEMRCSSLLPTIAKGKEVVQREYRVDLSETPPATKYRLRVIKLSRPWHAHDLQSEWRRTCDRMHKRDTEQHTLFSKGLLKGLDAMEAISSLVGSPSELLEITCCAINMSHKAYLDQAGQTTRRAAEIIGDLRRDRHSRVGDPAKKDHNERRAVTENLQEWATRLTALAWPQGPALSQADNAVIQKIREWARKYMYLNVDNATWNQVLGVDPPVSYQSAIRALGRIDSELRYHYETAENEEYRRQDTTATGISAVEVLADTNCADAHGEANEQAVTVQDAVNKDTGCPQEGMDISPTSSVLEGGETSETTTNTTNTTTMESKTYAAAAATPPTVTFGPPADIRPWWQKGYDDAEYSETEHHHFTHEGTRITNSKEAGILLHEYVRAGLPRALGIFKKLRPGVHGERLLKERKAVQYKSIDDQHQWLDTIEQGSPELGSVLRRCIGLYADNPAKSKAVIEYYATTGNANPRNGRGMRKELKEATRKHQSP